MGVRTGRKLSRSVVRWIGRGFARLTSWKNLTRPSYASDVPQQPLVRYMRYLEDVSSGGKHEADRVRVEHVRGHRFDLLGSGWVQVHHGTRCHGVEGHRYPPGPSVQPDRSGQWLVGRINRANLAEARRIWSLVDEKYTPIDWQLDFKSGFRWSENVWFENISYSYPPGVDIKVPWELARFQHLPWLGLAQPAISAACMREFRNQVLDFLATNPPGFGVNWRCAMDVAIRAANWLLAYDLLAAKGTVFDAEFDAAFRRSILEHGRYIVANLEWREELHGNHYLANIAGLAFIGAYLPRSAEVDVWLAFSAQELVAEVAHQFNADGSNFEASVCYHRLSTEMVLFATALLSNLPQEKSVALASYDPGIWRTRPSLRRPPIRFYPVERNGRQTPFPQWYWERMERMAEFTLHLTKPDGSVTQFGDNDSGRFFKLEGSNRGSSSDRPVVEYGNHVEQRRVEMTKCLHAVDLDHRHLVAGVNAFFSREDLAAFAPLDFAARVVSVLAGDIRVPSYRGTVAVPATAPTRVGSDDDWSELVRRLGSTPDESRCTKVFLADGVGSDNDLERYGYPDFGAYVFRSKRLFLAVRCGSVGQGGIGGHAHLDQLTLELAIDGKPLVSDPGTYLYTPIPEQRNAYRSARAHFVPHVPNREPGDLSRNLFRIDGRADGECLYFGPRGFAGRHFGYGQAVYRLVIIEPDRVVVEDFAEPGTMLADSAPEPLPFSPGYGRQHRSESR